MIRAPKRVAANTSEYKPKTHNSPPPFWNRKILRVFPNTGPGGELPREPWRTGKRTNWNEGILPSQTGNDRKPARLTLEMRRRGRSRSYHHVLPEIPNTRPGRDPTPEPRRGRQKKAQGDVSKTNETLGIKIKKTTGVTATSDVLIVVICHNIQTPCQWLARPRTPKGGST